MLVKDIRDVEKLRKLLNYRHQSYLLNGVPSSSCVQLQFEGVFNNAPVVWNARVRTMDDYLSRHTGDSVDPKQYIRIDSSDEGYQLEVGLHVRQIDRAVLERTIIMIRKYKRLQLGCHLFGAKSKINSI